MKTKIKNIINILNKALKENFADFKGAYLYGSFAKNTSHPESDIDIVALFGSEPNREKMSIIWGIVGPIEAQYDVFLDLHPMTKAELSRNPIYYNEVVNKGIFYDAA
ncbi:MAG: nucleotidyltransferase domain-containing protein [bacterium]